MEHLVDHLRNDLLPTVQGEDAIVPEGVTQRSADVDGSSWWSRFSSVKAVTMPLSASLTTVVVVSDCADIIEFGGSFVPVSVDRQIQRGA